MGQHVGMVRNQRRSQRWCQKHTAVRHYRLCAAVEQIPAWQMAHLQEQGCKRLGIHRVRVERQDSGRHTERPQSGHRIQMAFPYYRQRRHRLQNEAKTIAAVFLPEKRKSQGHQPWAGHLFRWRGLQKPHRHKKNRPLRLEDDPMDHKGRFQHSKIRPWRSDRNKAVNQHLRYRNHRFQSHLQRCPMDDKEDNGPQRGHRMETRKQTQLRYRP